MPRSPHVFALEALPLAPADPHPDAMLVQKAYKFRIYPNGTQEELLLRTIGCCRLLYNLCLDQKKLEWERSNPRRLTAFDQMKELKALKREFPFLKEPPNHSLQQAIHDLHKAFKNFFEPEPGFRRFAGRARTTAFAIPIRNRSRSRTIVSSCPRPVGRGWSCTGRSSGR